MPHARGLFKATLAWHYRRMEEIVITHGGRRVVTTGQASELHAIPPATLRKEIQRLGLEPAAHLDARTPLYDAEQLAEALAARPGKGAHLRRESALSADSA